jgi:hypothetical protein
MVAAAPFSHVSAASATSCLQSLRGTLHHAWQPCELFDGVEHGLELPQ